MGHQEKRAHPVTQKKGNTYDYLSTDDLTDRPNESNRAE
jgi:hypothetical protein